MTSVDIRTPEDAVTPVPLGLWPTPVHPLARLSADVGGRILIKRDDLNGFGLAGNKTRALEHLLGDALARGCTVVVSAGAPGSNFLAGVALACRVVGLQCVLLLPGEEPLIPSTTMQMARAAGATLEFTGAERHQLDALVEARSGALASAGLRPYAIPRGGATAVGALGFAHAAWELKAQLRDDPPDVVVMAVGSGASLAGFVAGSGEAPWRTVGVSVSRDLGEMTENVSSLARACADRIGARVTGRFDLLDASATGFGVPTDADRRAFHDALVREGVMLDATYGTKAMQAATDLAGDEPDSTVLLWHCGGLPGALDLLEEVCVP
jgi:D-cysteine desulfhydrase